MKHGISISRAIAAGFFTSVCFSSAALAVTTTVAFQVRATITAECKLVSGDFIDFGEHGVIDANIDKIGRIAVQCTTGTPYSVGLGLGTSATASAAARQMTGGSGAETLNYNLYKDAGFTSVWGVTIPTDTVAATGNGSPQDYPVYGRRLPVRRHRLVSIPILLR